MRRGAAAAGAAPPSYEFRPQFKALTKKFASISRQATKRNDDAEDLETLQQQLQQASIQLESVTAHRREPPSASARHAELAGKAAPEPKSSIQMFIDAVSKQCGGTLKPLMYAKPAVSERNVLANDFKTEAHDRPSAIYQASHNSSAEVVQESVIITLLSVMNGEDLIGKIHAAFLSPDGSKRKLDIYAFVEHMVGVLLNAPDKAKFPPGFATEEKLLPLLCDIFSAIDCENRGNITWEELSTCMLQGAMQHASDVKLSRVFETRPLEEVALLFKRPGGTLWLNERQWVATWDKGCSVLHLIDWERMTLVAQLPNAATIVTATCTAKNRLAVSLFNHTVVIWNTASFDGMVIEHMMLHSCSQVALLWQANVSRLLCGGSDGTLTCWNCSATPVKLFANQIHSDSVRVLTNITGMESFVTSGNDGKVFLLDQFSLKVRRSYKGHTSNVHSICWEPTLKLIITASISSEIIGYSPYSDRELFRLVKHLVAVSGLFAMSDVPILLSWDVGGSICVWDLATTDFHQMLFIHHELRGSVQCIIPVMRRHVLYLVGPRYTMPIDFSISSFPHLADDEPIVSVRYSDAYSMIATATARTIRLWSAQTGQMLRTIEPPIAGYIVSLSVDSSGKKLFVCASAGSAYRMDFASGIITQEYTPHSVAVTQHLVNAAGLHEVKETYERKEASAAVYVPEDCTLVTCGWDAKIIVHDDINDCAQGKTSLRIMESHRKDLNCIAVSWSSRLVAAAGVEGFISCWDFEQPGGKMFDFCMGHTMDTTALAFLEPYPLLSSCDSSGNVAIWIVPPHHPSALQCVRLPPATICDGNLIHGRYLCVSHVLLRTGATAIAWVFETKSMFVADDEGSIHLFDLRQLLASGSFHPLPQRPPTNAGELRVRKHSVTPRLPAKYPKDGWPTDLPKWLPRAVPPHCADYFAKLTPLVAACTWRAHSSTVQSMSACYTVAGLQPALLSSGDDRHVRLWDMNGSCLGSLAQMLSCADVPWTFDPQLQLKQSRRASTMQSVLCAVAPMFHPPVPSVKLDLGKLKPSSTFLTQMQSARLPRGKKRRESKNGFLTDRGSANGTRAQVVADQSSAANQFVAKAFASAVRRSSVGGGK